MMISVMMMMMIYSCKMTMMLIKMIFYDDVVDPNDLYDDDDDDDDDVDDVDDVDDDDDDSKDGHSYISCQCDRI